MATISILLLKGNLMAHKMNRKLVQTGSADQLDKRNNEYWKNAPLKEKVATITYLRECFYGPEATTGRLQRFHQV